MTFDLNRNREILPTHDIKIFSGRSNPQLTQEIADYLGTRVAPMIIKNFSDGEELDAVIITHGSIQTVYGIGYKFVP